MQVEKRCAKHFCTKKFAHKKLMKLTPAKGCFLASVCEGHVPFALQLIYRLLYEMVTLYILVTKLVTSKTLDIALLSNCQKRSNLKLMFEFNFLLLKKHILAQDFYMH